MKKCLLFALVAVGCAVDAATERVRLDRGWVFTKGTRLFERSFSFDRMETWLDGWVRDGTNAMDRPATVPYARPDFDDTGWRPVRVPHDFALENGFAYDRPSALGCVDTGRSGWYRLRIGIDGSKLTVGDRVLELAPDGRVFFECDGAMSFAMVWMNGRFAGGWPYGYTPWRLELTPFLDRNGTNTLAVRTACIPDSARFYVGAGLYRDCHLAVSDDDHLVPDSVAITTPSVTRDAATVKVVYTMSRSGRKERIFQVENPRLWDVDDPHLYTVEIEGETFRYGIRTFGFFSDQRAFQLNGRRVPIKGMCLHQDLDVLGSVWNRSAWKRRLLKLKEMGMNAVRMSHYRHPAGLYGLCDELGILVMDEFFDQWNRPFNDNDYHRLFPAWHARDLRASIRAGRNHPSIVLWGLGNEIPEQRGDMQQLDLGLFRRTGDELLRIVREEDPTRPVTTANNNKDPAVIASDAVDFVDVYGFNYRFRNYGQYRAARPGKPMLSTETGCNISTRGEYFFPVKRTWDYVDLHSSGYPVKHICLMEDEWAAHEAEPSHTGGFYWTGFDYLGAPDAMPAVRRKAISQTEEGCARMASEIAMYGSIRDSCRACPFGVFDLAGFPRDIYWQFKSRWRPDVPTVHIYPHWNWPERVGQTTPVHVFTSGDEVELFVNGVSQGRLRPAFPGARCEWNEVVYRPGAVRAVAYRNGKVWCEETVRTTGAPARIRLEHEKETPLVADGESVAVVNLSVLDEAGLVVPRTRLPVRVEVSENLELVGIENGDEADLSSFKATERIAFNGRLSIVVRAKSGSPASGRITVTALGNRPVKGAHLTLCSRVLEEVL